MSENTIEVKLEGNDLELVFEFHGTYSDWQDGGHEMYVVEVYENGGTEDVIDNYDCDMLDQLVEDNADLGQIAIEGSM